MKKLNEPSTAKIVRSAFSWARTALMYRLEQLSRTPNTTRIAIGDGVSNVFMSAPGLGGFARTFDVESEVELSSLIAQQELVPRLVEALMIEQETISAPQRRIAVRHRKAREALALWAESIEDDEPPTRDEIKRVIAEAFGEPEVQP